MWRKKITVDSEQPPSLNHNGGSDMTWACTAASRPGSLLSIDDVTADSSTKMFQFQIFPVFLPIW